MLLVPAANIITPNTALGIVAGLGLTSGLITALDPRDPSSYPGTGQTWSDVSGQNNHFFLGDTGGVEATDPVFSVDHWNMDSDAEFTEAAAHTAYDGFHKNNAAFTIALAYKFSAINNLETSLFENASANTEHGIELELAQDNLVLTVRNGSGTAPLFKVPAETLVTGPYNFVGVAINESTGVNGLNIQVNSIQELFTSTYVSPSSTNPTDPTVIFSNSGEAGCEAGFMLIWNTRLSDANLMALFNAFDPIYNFG